MRAKDEIIHQISETLEKKCNIAEEQEQHFRPKASSLPTTLVRTIQLKDDDDSNEIGIPTTIILQMFSDKTFLSITQFSGKMGTLLLCNAEESLIDNSTTYHINTLLGTGVARGSGTTADQEVSLREVCVRRLVESIVLHARKMAGVGEGTLLCGANDGTGPIPPVLVGLGLRPNKYGKMMSAKSFKTIIGAAMELYEEGWLLSHPSAMMDMEGPD